MDKKKNIKRIVALVCIVAVVALLAAMPLLAGQDQQEDDPQASILSGTVSAGSIDTELIGGGTLTQEDAVTISVPAAVKLTEFLVSNGDTVTEGTAIASVDRVTVMTAITQVQETLEHLSEEIEAAGEITTTEKVNALAGGIVKLIYAEEGEAVQSVMLEHGALAVLSLDGLMAVDFQTESTLSAGTAVTVTLSDGAVVEGKIVKNLAGEMTVTVEDDDYSLGEAVQVTAEDGSAIGSGELYIYSPWNATAYAGTVGSIKVGVGDELSAGKTLMVLEDVGYSATYRQLITQRQEYEELMLELFKMYQTETITAPCDGVVSGIDKDSAQLLAAQEGGWSIQLLVNAPNGDDETVYQNYIGQVATVADNGWVLKLNPQSVAVADYLDLSGVSLDTALMTQTVLYTRNGAPVFTLTDGFWTQTEEVGVGDILLFAADGQGNIVWNILVQKAAVQPEQPGDPTTPTEPGTPADPTTPTEPGTPADPTTPTEPGTPGGSESGIPGGSESGTPGGSVPGDSGSSMPGNTGGSMPSGGSFPSGGSSFSGGSFGGMTGGMTEQEPEFELYELDMADIAAVTPQDTMTMEITIDEQDIRQLQVGMTAQVKIDALGGEKYTATITEIGNTGENSGGSSKYPVELTMDRAENMLSGMNATATIVLSTVENVLTIPADALVEQANSTLVYTGYDEETQTLVNPVEVTVGCSDGETVEILEGLAESQTYYYAYYDTLEVSFTPDFGGMGGGFPFG